MYLEYGSKDLLDTISDPRVLRVLEIALRDNAIRRRFGRLREEMTAADAVLQLAGEFFLSDEHIRTIIYRKGKG